MHIGVDATCWLLPRGLGRYARGLLTALRQADARNNYTFFTDTPEAVELLAALGPVRQVKTSRRTLAAVAAGGSRSARDLLAMSRALADASIDLLLFPTTHTYVPVLSRAKKLMLFHVAVERFPGLVLEGRRANLRRTAKVTLARRQADAIATVSEYSRRALIAEFKLPPDRVHVVGDASDPIFRRLDPRRPTARLVAANLTGQRRLIVCVGGFSPHKNLPMLIDVFGGLAGRPDCTDVDLVLVGEHEHETFRSCYEEMRTRIRTRQLEPRVILTGFLPDADLVALLNLATVLVLPSMIEGFGLPAVEAAACGCPVIATSESPLPELLGDGGLYIDPRSAVELVGALNKVLTSPERQAHMRQAGMAAAARLTWDAAASTLIALMERTAAQ